MDSISKSIAVIAENTASPKLDQEQTILLFNTVLAEHIEKKLTFICEILRNNDIKQRHDQIKKNIATKIKEISLEESNKLAQFQTVAGNLGNILLKNVDYEIFTNEVCEIVFCESPAETKLKDLRVLMTGYVSDLVQIINEKIKNN
ncbi:MAG TPA: hypothetical protein PLQ36_02840 [Candidatus Gracilibacteria bacterium]|nr:hypothetical protein [Candidatus Gracilibacteria bacterium]